MKKFKLILLLSSFLISQISYAYSSPFDGFYVGMKGGGMISNIDLNRNSSGQVADIFVAENISALNSFNANVNRNSFLGSLYLGFGRSNRCLYLSGEGFANFANRNVTQNNSILVATAAPTYLVSEQLIDETKLNANAIEVGIDFKPGILLSENTLLYARMGGAYNKFTLRNTTTSISTDIYNGALIDTTTQSLALKNTEGKVGIRLGLGIEHKLSRRIGILFDYIFTDYGNINVSGTANTVTRFGTVSNGLNNYTKVSLKNQAVMLGISYTLT